MSDLDLSAAARVGATALHVKLAHDGHPEWCGAGPTSQHVLDAQVIIAAAAPLIERAVRAEVAQAIESNRIQYDRTSREITHGNPSAYDQGITDAYDLAARIARGNPA